MKIISHRGGTKIAPENSLKAIKKSVELGVDGIEIDVRLTKDKKLVVFHDKRLIRLAYSNKSISDFNFEDAIKIKLRSGEKIISLETAIKAAKGTLLEVEGKGRGWSKPLSEILKDKDTKNFRVISFNSTELRLFKKLQPKFDCYLIRTVNVYGAVKTAKKQGFDGLKLNYFALTPGVFQTFEDNNLGLNVYTINNGFIAKLIAKYYPQVDITTDAPDKLIEALKQA